MVKNRDQIEAQALELSARERAELAHILIQSLDEAVEDPAEVERAWEEEIKRRVSQVEAGEAKLIPAAEVIRKARERLR